MIQPIIEYINTQVAGLNIFKEVKGLCQYAEQVESDEQSSVIKRFPAYYKGKDQLSNITDYDFRNGVVFHLKNGDVNIEELESRRASTSFFKYTTPIKCIAIHLRQVIDDSAYTPDKMALNLVNKINDQVIKSLTDTLGVNKITVQASSYGTDPVYIDTLFQNVEVNFKEELCIVTIDYSIVIEAYQNCFNTFTC